MTGTPFHLFNKSATIRTKTMSQGDYGERTYVTANTYTNVPCAIQAGGANEGDRYGQAEHAERLFNGFFPITFGTSDITFDSFWEAQVDGRVYEAIGPGRDETGLGVFQVVALRESPIANNGGP